MALVAGVTNPAVGQLAAAPVGAGGYVAADNPGIPGNAPQAPVVGASDPGVAAPVAAAASVPAARVAPGAPDSANTLAAAPAPAAPSTPVNPGIPVPSSATPVVASSPPLSSDPAITGSLQSTLSAISSGSSSVPSSTKSDSDSESSSKVSSTSSSSPSPTQSNDHKDGDSGWPQMKQWVIPVAAIGGCLLLFSLVGRFISLYRRRQRRREARINGLASGRGDEDGYDEGGGFLTKNISRDTRTSVDYTKRPYGGSNNANFTSLGQFEHNGSRDPPPGYKEPCEPELGYNDEELRGISSAARQPSYLKGWGWMKKNFTNERAFGSKYNQGPPMKRSVLSFVNLSPFSDRGARADASATQGQYTRANGEADQFWSPITAKLSPQSAHVGVASPPGSGWRDASSRPFTSTDRGSAERFNVPRRPVNKAYMPISSAEADGRPSIAAVLATDASNNRLAGDTIQPPKSSRADATHVAGPARSPTTRSKPETAGGVAAWREAIRKISGGGYSYKREHEQTPNSELEDEEESDAEDVAPTARQTSYNYRSVSQEYDPDTSGPIQRSTSQSTAALRRGTTLARKSTVATRSAAEGVHAEQPYGSQPPPSLEEPTSTAALQRKRTIKLPDENAGPSRAASRISRSPSKYPGRGADGDISPTSQSDAKSIMTVDTETRAVLNHLQSPDHFTSDTPENGSVINFEGAPASRTPSSRSPSRLQRQGTVRSYMSSGGEHSGKRDQRLRRAETVVQNAVKRAATSAKKGEEQDADKQKLRRAATAASSESSDRKPIDLQSRTHRGQESTSSKRGDVNTSPSRQAAGLNVPSTSMYKLARQSLQTQTPEVPQFREMLSPGADTPQVSSDEQSSIRPTMGRTQTAASSRSGHSSSGEDGPPSLVHGGTSSEEDDDVMELSSADGHTDFVTSSQGKLAGREREQSVKMPSYLSRKEVVGSGTPQRLDTLDTYRLQTGSPTQGEDVFAAMGRLGSHNLDFSLKSPLAGEDNTTIAPPASGKSVGSQINAALDDLTTSRSHSKLQRSSPTRKGPSRSLSRKQLPEIGVQEATPTESERAEFEGEAEQYAFTQPTQKVGEDRGQGVELFDPPVVRAQDTESQSSDGTGYDTPTTKRSWKQENGRWVAAEQASDYSNGDQRTRAPTSPEQGISPPPLPSPPKAASLNPLKDGSASTPRRERRQRQGTSDAGDGSATPSRRRQRTETPEARLKATTSPASPSPFGRHAELFFSPPLGGADSATTTPRRQNGAPVSKYRSPRNVVPATGSPLRAPTTRTSNILQADRVRPWNQRQDSDLTSGTDDDARGLGNETPAGTSALNSLAFNSPFAAGTDTPLSVIASPTSGPPAPRSEASSSSDTTYQHSEIERSDLLRYNTALNAGATRLRRGTVSSRGESSASEYQATDAPTVSSHRSWEEEGDESQEERRWLSKKNTKSNATLSSCFTTVSESQAALSEAEHKGRVGLDSEIEKMLQRRGGTSG